MYHFSSAISMSDSDIGRTDLVQHHVDIQGVRQQRRLPFHHRDSEEIKQMLVGMLEKENKEPAAGPSHLGTKEGWIHSVLHTDQERSPYSSTDR